MAARPDLVMAAAATDPDDKRALDAIVDQAAEAAKAHAAATTGTALHAFTERLDRGRPLGIVPADYVADIEAYRAATADFEHMLIEQFTVNDKLKIGGTPDRVLMYQGQAYIGDLKTGSITYGAAKIAMQLAVYAHSTPYDHVTQTRTPYPADVSTTRGIVIHLPAGTGKCELHWIDLDAGWDGVFLAGSVRQWRTTKNLTTPITPPGTVAFHAETLEGLEMLEAIGEIGAALTVERMREIYRAAVAAGVDGERLLPFCLNRKNELESKAA
jgi:hypothetical protein